MIDIRKKFCLDGERFDRMREELDAYIRNAFAVMDRKGVSKARIGLKIDIEKEEYTTKDERGFRTVVIPKVDYKMDFKLEAKSESKNEIVGAEGRVVKDGFGEYYIVSEEEAEGQMSFFEDNADTSDE